MGQGHSTRNAHKPSKYSPREPAVSSKHKSSKRGNKSAGSTSSKKKGRGGSRAGEREGEAERLRSQPQPQVSERTQPHVQPPPPHPQVTPRPTHTPPFHTSKTTTASAHPPSHRSKPASVSLTKQTSSGSTGSGGGGVSAASKHVQIEWYFNQYKDKEEDKILAEGMERFCIDLDVDPTEFIVLVLAWKFGASEMCRFTREEFMNGCQNMKAYDAKSLQNRFPELLQDARGENFKDLYQFTFSFGLDHSTGQRSLPVDMAIQLWELVFTQEKPTILERWFDFLRESEARGISRDTWNMFLDFCHNVAPDLSDYDESEAWPSLFDDFVEYENAK